MRSLLLLLALWCTHASAYLGSFVPTLDRNVVTVEFIDTQVAGAACAALALQALNLRHPLPNDILVDDDTEPIEF